MRREIGEVCLRIQAKELVLAASTVAGAQEAIPAEAMGLLTGSAGLLLTDMRPLCGTG
jgi:hypothetical protein